MCSRHAVQCILQDFFLPSARTPLSLGWWVYFYSNHNVQFKLCRKLSNTFHQLYSHRMDQRLIVRVGLLGPGYAVCPAGATQGLLIVVSYKLSTFPNSIDHRLSENALERTRDGTEAKEHIPVYVVLAWELLAYPTWVRVYFPTSALEAEVFYASKVSGNNRLTICSCFLRFFPAGTVHLATYDMVA